MLYHPTTTTFLVPKVNNHGTLYVVHSIRIRRPRDVRTYADCCCDCCLHRAINSSYASPKRRPTSRTTSSRVIAHPEVYSNDI